MDDLEIGRRNGKNKDRNLQLEGGVKGGDFYCCV